MNKKYFIIAAFVLTLVACGGETTENNDTEESVETTENEVTEEVEENLQINTLIANNEIGDFRIGNQIPVDFDHYTIDVDIKTVQEEGETYEIKTYIVNLDRVEIMRIEPNYDYDTGLYGNNIGEINSGSNQFKTAERIGVGSTITEFIAAYPDAKIWYTYISDTYIIETPTINCQFIVASKDFTGEITDFSDMVILQQSDFNPETKILKIRMFGA